MNHLNYRKTQSAAFSLIELLIVMGIMSLMGTIALVSFAGLANKKGFGQDIYQMEYTFDQARAYALANNTYVFVGITEVDGSQLSTASPQINGNGRIAMAVVASNDGTRMYDQGLGQWSTDTSVNPLNVTPIMPLQYFDDIHMVDFSSISTPSSGGMDRPAVSSNYSLANNSATTGFGFNWPLAGPGSGKYTFTKVVAFDPSGEATLLPATYSVGSSGVVTSMEIGLQPAHGSVIPPLPTNLASGTQAAIQIDGVSGLVTLYQP